MKIILMIIMWHSQHCCFIILTSNINNSNRMQALNHRFGCTNGSIKRVHTTDG